MKKEDITINGLVPFEMKGDAQKFDDAYIPYFLSKGLSPTDAINIVSSIWLFGNDQWIKGFKFGRSSDENEFEE